MRKTKTKKWLTALFTAGSLWASAQFGKFPPPPCSTLSPACATGTYNVCELVNNGGFETVNGAVGDFGELARACGWTCPSWSTPDLFSATSTVAVLGIPCNGLGYQPSRTAGTNYYAGIYTTGYFGDYSEYIQTQLKQTLEAGKVYEISCWVSRADFQPLDNPRLDFFFTDYQLCFPGGTGVPKNSTFNQANIYSPGSAPQPVYTATGTVINTSTDWVEIKFIYCATGNENYLQLGNYYGQYSTSTTPITYTNGCALTSASTDTNSPYYSYGPGYLYIDDVSVKEVSSTLAFSPNGNCQNNPVTFTITPPSCLSLPSNYFNYNWGDGSAIQAGGVNASHTYTASGNYTVTVTFNLPTSFSCTPSYTTVVNVADCCVNNNSNPITLQNVTIVAPGVSATNWNTLVSGPIYTGSISLPTSNYVITGNYTVRGNLNVNTPVTFSLCNMAMNDAATINQYSNLTINRSYLYSCNKLWTGIMSRARLTLNHTVIEDAYIGINAGCFLGIPSHAGVIVDDAVFNKNYYSIIAAATTMNPSDFIVNGSIFTSRNLLATYNFTNNTRFATSGVCLPLSGKVPQRLKGSTTYGIVANTIRANIGVFFLNLTSSNATIPFSLGAATTATATNPTNAQLTNYFDYINEGVYNALTKVFVKNCNFANIKTLSGGVGTSLGAIYHDDGTYNDRKTETTVGSNGSGSIPTSNFKCVFSTVGDGVAATNGGTINVNYNDFNNVSGYGMKVTGWNGTYTTSTSETVNLAANTFTDAAYVFYANNNASIKATVKTNTLVHVQNTYTANYNVYVNETGKPAAANYTVSGNNFVGSLYGVYFTNTAKSAVYNNSITIKKPGTGVFNSAINLDNSDQFLISDNTVNCNPTNSTSWYTFGIFSNAAKSNTFQCNTITKVGSCMKFQGDCSPSYNYQNSLNDNSSDPCLFGVMLDNSGKTGNIGYYSGGVWYTADNKWGDYAYGISGADTYCQNSSNNPASSIYYDNTKTPVALYTPSVNTSGVLPALPFNISANTSPIGNNCGQLSNRLMNTESSDGKGVDEENGNQFVGGVKTKNVFTTLVPSEKKRVIIYNETSHQKGTATNEHNFYVVDSLLELYSLNRQQSLLNQAMSLNNSINAVNNIDVNQKQLNQIYAVYLQDDSLVTSNQIQDLADLAWMCPFTEGLAVFQARGLIHNWDDSTFYFNPCEINAPETSANRFADLTNKEEVLASQIAVFPNPSNGNLVVNSNVKECIFEVYDLMGKKVLSQKLNEGESKVDLTSLNNGTYLFKVSQNGKTVKTDKVVLSK